MTNVKCNISGEICTQAYATGETDTLCSKGKRISPLACGVLTSMAAGEEHPVITVISVGEKMEAQNA